MIDSGANFSIYNRYSAEQSVKYDRNIDLVSKNSNHTVIYGNGSSETTNQQLQVTSQFKAVVMSNEKCPQNLLSVKALTDHNCTAIFKKTLCIIEPRKRRN